MKRLEVPALAGADLLKLRSLSREAAMKYWVLVEDELPLERAVNLLARADLFYLLVRVCGREDLLRHKFFFDRCREVEAAPDGYLDLWAREHGKDLADDTPMLTANRGWTTHGDLKVGDHVFAPSGKAVRVVALSERYADSRCYRIEFSDGTRIVAGAWHLWRLRRKHKLRLSGTDDRVVRFSEEVVATEELSGDARCDVGVCAALEMPHADLPIDPYVLGVWLGDGHSGAAVVTMLWEDAQPFLRALEANGHTWRARRTSSRALSYVIDERDRSLRCIRGHERTPQNVYRHGCRICRAQQRRERIFGESRDPVCIDGLSWRLRRLGLLCDPAGRKKGNRKHIPAAYKQTSVGQRMRLLRGLMDTDGDCNERGTATFSNTNMTLALDVYELATGLGLRPRFRRSDLALDSPKSVNGRYVFYQVSFQAHKDRNPFALKRKAVRAIDASVHRDTRLVKSVTPVATVPTRCIQVEGDLYCAGRELIPTHNSSIITFGLTIQDILKDPEVTVGIFSHTRPIAKAFLRQIMRELEANRLLHAAFPHVLWGEDVRAAPKWSEDEGMIVKRRSNPNEATVEAWGLVDGQPTALDCDTPVLTTSGWKRHGDLAFGDFVFDEHGDSVMVIHNTGVMIGKPCSEVIFSDTSIVAADDHLWPVQRVISPRNPETGRQDSGWSKFDVEIVKTVELPLSSGPERDKRRRLPRTPILKIPRHVEFPIPPYVLGLWLGDGSSDTGIITTADEEIVDLLAANGYSVSVAQDRVSYRMYRVAGLREQLKAASLLWNKHIPQEYLLTPQEDRTALLQGLMDSDGSCHSNGWGSCIFSNTNLGLMEGVHYLAASLGMKPNRISAPYHDGHPKHAPRYTVSFLGLKSERPFQLPRKLIRCRDFRRNEGRYVREIRKVETRPVNCIQVASESGLYLAGRALVPTHNSKHYRVLVYDDVVVAGSVTTPDMIAKTMQEMERSYNLGTTPGVRRATGTRWHFNDAYRTMIDRASFSSRLHPGRVGGTEEGESVLWDEKTHEDKRRDMGPYTYAAQILLNPRADALQGFKREWLRFHDRLPARPRFNVYILVDSANSKRRESDYTAIWVLGLGPDGNYYALEMVRDRLNLTERVTRVMEMHRRWKPRQVRWERYGMMADIEALKREQEAQNYRFDVLEVAGQTSKDDRIRRLIPIFEQGRLYLPRSLHVTDWQKTVRDLVRDFVEEEYYPFPVSLHKDMLDSLSRIAEPELKLEWPKEEKAASSIPDRRFADSATAWMA